MKTYSIAKVGKDYVVRVDHLGVISLPSRRAALRLVAEAEALLGEAASDEAATTVPSMPREDSEVS
jgi:hypothetical protein